MVELNKAVNVFTYAVANNDSNGVTVADIKPDVDTTSHTDGESGADSCNPFIAVRPVVSRRSQQPDTLLPC